MRDGVYVTDLAATLASVLATPAMFREFVARYPKKFTMCPLQQFVCQYCPSKEWKIFVGPDSTRVYKWKSVEVSGQKLSDYILLDQITHQPWVLGYLRIFDRVFERTIPPHEVLGILDVVEKSGDVVKETA